MGCFPDIPNAYRAGAEAAASALRPLDKVLIAAHVRPDGDAVGSMLACGCIERALGHQFILYFPDGIPEYLQFMGLPGPVSRSLEDLPFRPSAAVYVDCSEAGRLGAALERVCGDWPSINIDHHLCQQGLGSLANFIETGAAATCQLMAYIAAACGLRPEGALGEDLAVGLITDTGNFSHNNTSADVFRLCACLEENGVQLSAIRSRLQSRWSLNRLRLWGSLFMQVGQAKGNRIAWSVITEEDLRNYGCGNDELEGYIDSIGRLKGVEIAFTLRGSHETYPGGYELPVSRLSMRSKGHMNVQEIAASFGGGGHKNAAGATLNAEPWLALPEVLKAIDAYLDKHAL